MEKHGEKSEMLIGSMRLKIWEGIYYILQN